MLGTGLLGTRCGGARTPLQASFTRRPGASPPDCEEELCERCECHECHGKGYLHVVLLPWGRAVPHWESRSTTLTQLPHIPKGPKRQPAEVKGTKKGKGRVQMGRFGFSFQFPKQFLAAVPGQGLSTSPARPPGREEEEHDLWFSTTPRKGSSGSSTSCQLAFKEPSSRARKTLQWCMCHTGLQWLLATRDSSSTVATILPGDQRETPSVPTGTGDYRTQQ